MEGPTIDLSMIIKQLLSSVPIWAITFAVLGGFASLVIFLTKLIVDELKEIKADVKSVVKIIDKSGVENLPEYVAKTNEFRAKTEEEIRSVWRKIEHRRPS